MARIFVINKDLESALSKSTTKWKFVIGHHSIRSIVHHSDTEEHVSDLLPFLEILKNGPFNPMVRVEESTDEYMVILAHYAPKNPSEYTEPEKEKVSLDSGLQLILIESLDNVMYNNIVNCDTAKQIWLKIEILCKGTEEVRSNQRRILISQYESFMAKPKESITDMFERFNKLINDLQLHDKYYEAEEVNLKFLFTLPDHLEQKISAIREGRDLIRITLEVLYGILKTYELEMIQRKSLRVGQEHVVDGSSALIINESQTSNDEPRSQTSVASTSEQRNNDSQEQVILELEEDEFCTLDELDELDQSKAYLARKFSNIRVKNPRFFKGHFATEYRKPKKAKKDKSYLVLEAKYEALLKKQQSKAYIAEGKSWDDSDNDEDEEVGNYALMALEQGESSSSKTRVPTLTIIDLNNKINCANEIEVVLREKLEKNDVKLKSFRNVSELVGQYHEKNKSCANIAIGLDYDALNNKKKDVREKGKANENEDVPTMLKKVGSAMFKACEVDFSEEELIKKQEIVNEDNEKKNAETTQTSKAEKKLMDNQDSKTPVEKIKTKDARKKKKNRNGKIGINKSNNFAYVADAPRKKCEKCGYVNHLCKKVISKPVEGACKYNGAKANDPFFIL
ncbi:hypothetical protein AgCh_006582 [Apium graveolens]